VLWCRESYQTIKTPFCHGNCYRPTQGFKFDAKTLFYLYPDDPVSSPKTARLSEHSTFCLINSTLDHNVRAVCCMYPVCRNVGADAAYDCVQSEALVGYTHVPKLQSQVDCDVVERPPRPVPRTKPKKKKKRKKRSRSNQHEL